MIISTELILNASQQDELITIFKPCSQPAGYVFRAKLILMLIEGASFRTIKHMLGTTEDLALKLRRYISADSAIAKPIRWKYSDLTRRIRGNFVSATCH